ncbi:MULTISPECIES: hypothetical protein [unclassified Imperialibacter]|uniref:hypothetical protein n=1 Tax=unclassified Imperialibacter TaxID=2629706 RepID=UPI001257524D|nr:MULTISPECIES: hypothetical protein [unclassified Imperialibacter]CAD5293072.1 exported hypothetical protein [Imperialibacter sp. 89]CAD5294133.1 exported hypothetical protein [Imperialibacter sp. 75]VVT18543.1 exported hypothetical protein [Imperialibacter sp. EC-SDR9]
MKILATVFIVVFSCLHSFADQKWSQGVVVLTSGEVKVGLLQYHPKWNAVSFKKEEKELAVQTFPANKLSQFSFFDDHIEVWRRFYTYISNKRGFNQPVFYEVVIKGDFSLLRKEKPIEPMYQDGASSASSINERMIWEQVAGFDFFLSHNSNIVPLGSFKKYIKEEGLFEELDNFADIHRLSWRESYDIVMMINYLNCSSGSGGCQEDLELTRLASSN